MMQLGQTERARYRYERRRCTVTARAASLLEPRCFGIYFVGTRQGNLRENKRRSYALGVVDCGSLLLASKLPLACLAVSIFAALRI
jgi:hypothetical protein